MPAPKESSVSDRDLTEEFVPLWTASQTQVLAYIRTLVYDPEAAEDILQRTSLVLWKKFSEFTLGTDFAAWACRIAYYEVKAWRRDVGRDRLIFNDALLEQLAQSAERRGSELDQLTLRLRRCLQRLSEVQRALLERKYAEGLTVKQIARISNRTPNAVSCLLYQARQALLKCMDDTQDK